MKYPKINGIFKRWQKDETPVLQDGVNYGDFKIGDFTTCEFEEFHNNNWIWTEKYNGTNIRIYIHKDDADGKPLLEIKGRGDDSMIPASLVKWIESWFTVNYQRIEKQFEGPVVLFGEGVGKKIQKNGHLYGDPHFRLFDVLVDRWWLKRNAVDEIGKKLGLITPKHWIGSVGEAIVKVKNKPIGNCGFGNYVVEGYVGTTLCGALDRSGNRIITKIKVKDFVK